MSLEPVPESTLAAIAAAYPGLPADYLSFLGTHGWGDLTSGARLYEGPISTDCLYGSRSSSLPEIVVFADDFAGTAFAFVPSQNWVIVAIDSLDLDMYPEGTFSEFLAQYHEPIRNAS
jgi:hypothetical protein